MNIARGIIALAVWFYKHPITLRVCETNGEEIRYYTPPEKRIVEALNLREVQKSAAEKIARERALKNQDRFAEPLTKSIVLWVQTGESPSDTSPSYSYSLPLVSSSLFSSNHH